MAEQIMRRIEAIENSVANLELSGAATDPIRPSESIRNLSDQIAQLRTKISELESTNSGPSTSRPDSSFGWGSKEMLPGIVSEHFKDKWRLWSYKARDYLSQ